MKEDTFIFRLFSFASCDRLESTRMKTSDSSVKCEIEQRQYMIYNLGRTFLVNAVTDSLILLIIKRELFPQIPGIRIWKSGVLSSITYIFWYIFSGYLPLWADIFLAVITVGGILVITFRIRNVGSFLVTVGVMMLYVFMFGGFGLLLQKKMLQNTVGAPSGWWIFLLCLWLFSGFVMVCRRSKTDSHRGENLYEVEIHRKDKAVSCRGIYDSGNLLVSQMTGTGITVLSWKKGKELFDEKEQEAMKKLITQMPQNSNQMSVKKLTQNKAGLWGKGVYPIRFQSVGRSEGCMPGIMADKIIVRKAGSVLAVKRGMVGISAETMSKDEKFSVLLPEDIFS